DDRPGNVYSDRDSVDGLSPDGSRNAVDRGPAHRAGLPSGSLPTPRTRAPRVPAQRGALRLAAQGRLSGSSEAGRDSDSAALSVSAGGASCATVPPSTLSRWARLPARLAVTGAERTATMADSTSI